MVTRAHYVLAVPDADQTAQWFIEYLGFETRWRDPGNWHAVVLGACGIHFGTCRDAIPPRDLGDHQYFAYLYFDDVDRYVTECRARGLDIPPPTDKPWGMRETLVTTPDGHRMMLAQMPRNW
jgi:catechol 2,3-dioxygenase-like lactoylglutathione lyase family enzyme